MGDDICMDGHCSHEQVHLCDGLVMDHVIECPKHNGRFDVRMGKALAAPVYEHLKTYPVQVETAAFRDAGKLTAHSGNEGRRTPVNDLGAASQLPPDLQVTGHGFKVPQGVWGVRQGPRLPCRPNCLRERALLRKTANAGFR